MQLMFLGFLMHFFIWLNLAEAEDCLDPRTTLVLSNTKFKKIGPHFLSISNIRCLYLKHNSIENLSDAAFDNLANLTYLNLEGNNLTRRSLGFVSKVQNLKTLVLNNTFKTYAKGNNEFTLDVFPPKLKSLYLKNNNIEELRISYSINASSLTSLRLEDSKISKIKIINKNGLLTTEDNFLRWLPQSLQRLHINSSELTEFILVNTTGLVEVTAYLDTLKKLKLENLNSLQILRVVCESPLNEISIKNLTKLTELMLLADQLDRLLYSDIHDLPQLTELTLESTKITHFDGKIVDFTPSLKVLLLSAGHLNAVPIIMNAPNLTSFRLCDSRIKMLKQHNFRAMFNLENLDLSYNLISEIEPGTFNNLKKLKTLFLYKNDLKSISHFEIGSLPNLKRLLLGSNQIHFFDGKIIDNNPSLVYLDLAKNHLQKVPTVRNAPNLEILILSLNQINILGPRDFQTLLNLKRLVLCFNNVNEIKPGTFDNLGKLEMLNLHNNQLKKLPVGWALFLNNLKWLTLENNYFNKFEALSLNMSPALENAAVSYTLRNEDIIYCTRSKDGNVNMSCFFPIKFKTKGLMFYRKHKFISLNQDNNF